MPLIQPPNDYGIPQPELIEPNEDAQKIWERNRRIEIYLNVKPWKCGECGATMFGRMKYCVYCKLRLGKDTPRPTEFKIGASRWIVKLIRVTQLLRT
jgi:hypothetical protein